MADNGRKINNIEEKEYDPLKPRLGKRQHWWQCNWDCENYLTDNEPWFTLAFATITTFLGEAASASLLYTPPLTYILRYIGWTSYCFFVRLVILRQKTEDILFKTLVPILEPIGLGIKTAVLICILASMWLWGIIWEHLTTPYFYIY